MGHSHIDKCQNQSPKELGNSQFVGNSLNEKLPNQSLKVGKLLIGGTFSYRQVSKLIFKSWETADWGQIFIPDGPMQGSQFL